MHLWAASEEKFIVEHRRFVRRYRSPLQLEFVSSRHGEFCTRAQVRLVASEELPTNYQCCLMQTCNGAYKESGCEGRI